MHFRTDPETTACDGCKGRHRSDRPCHPVAVERAAWAVVATVWAVLAAALIADGIVRGWAK